MDKLVHRRGSKYAKIPASVVLFVWACFFFWGGGVGWGKKKNLYFVYDFYCILLRKKGAGG